MSCPGRSDTPSAHSAVTASGNIGWRPLSTARVRCRVGKAAHTSAHTARTVAVRTRTPTRDGRAGRTRGSRTAVRDTHPPTPIARSRAAHTRGDRPWPSAACSGKAVTRGAVSTTAPVSTRTPLQPSTSPTRPPTGPTPCPCSHHCRLEQFRDSVAVYPWRTGRRRGPRLGRDDVEHGLLETVPPRAHHRRGSSDDRGESHRGR